MKDLTIFLQLATVANAISYSNQTDNPAKSFEIAEFGEDDGYPISHRQDLFIDCSSYSSWLQATAAAAKETDTIDSFATSASLGPAISSPTIPFEQYWCENLDETTEVGESIGPWLYGINASEKDYCLSLEKSNYSSWAALNPTLTTIHGYSSIFTTLVRSPSLWSPTLTQPCCGALCQIVASRVQLYFWPTPAPYPNVTTIVGSNGFVYTSPSVYVVYRSLHATGQCGTLGPYYSSITLSYHQTDLSTNVDFPEKTDPVAINYADLFTNCTSPATVQRSGQRPESDASNEAVHCSPLLQMPAGLQSVNSAWSICVDTLEWDVTGYVMDPPRALIPAAALVPAQTEEANPTTTAAPVSLASQPLPRKTTPPSPPTILSGPGIDPANGNHPSMKTDAVGGISSREGKDPFISQFPSTASSSQKGVYAASASSPASGDKAQQGNDLPTNLDPSTAINLSAGTIAPPGNNAAQVNHLPADSRASEGVGQLVGDDPHDGKATQTPKSTNLDPSKVSPPVDQQLGGLSGSQTSAGIDPARLGAPFTTTIGGHVVQAASSSNAVLVDGQYLSRGKGLITISNTPIALHSNGDLVFGASTAQSILPNPPPISATVTNAADRPLTISLNGIAIAGTTLIANGPAITLAGTPISLGTSGLVVGPSTILLPSPSPTSIITIAGQKYTISRAANGVSIAGTTGNPAITISGTPAALDVSGLVINGTSTVRYQSPLGVSAPSNGIPSFIASGLNSSSTLPLITAASSIQTLGNTTRTTGGPEVFLGRGDRGYVPVHYGAVMAVIILLTPFLYNAF